MRPGLAVACVAFGAALAGAAAAQSVSATNPPPPPRSLDPVGESQRSNRGFEDPPTLVFAVVGGHLVSGLVQPSPRRIGTLRLADEAQAFVCVGDLGAMRRGYEARLACSDGSQARLFAGRRGDRNLAVGVRAKTAAKRLAPPPGYELVADRGRLRMQPVDSGREG